MTQVGRSDSPVIGRVVLLADHSAQHVIAGLSQLDRLLRTLEECFAPALAQGTGPAVVIVWRTQALREDRRSLLPATHQLASQVIPAVPGNTLILRSNVVFRRGGLAKLLRSAKRHPCCTILGPADFPAAAEALERSLGSGGNDEQVWILESPADLPKVERQLVRATGKPTDGLVSRTLNRPISQLLSRWLVQTRVTPNQISFFVLGVLAAATWTVARGTPLGFVIGVLLFHLASVLDGCDGEIARAKFLETRRGAWLDTSVDLLGNFLLPLAIAVGLSRQAGLSAELRSSYLLEGLLTSAGIAIGVFGVARARPRGGRADFNDFGSSAVERFGVPRWLTGLLQGLVHLLRRDSYVFLFVILAVLGQPEWILHFLAIGVAMHLPVIAWSWWTNARIAASLKTSDRP
jgi:phosphatidylglycerophosphate synthase